VVGGNLPFFGRIALKQGLITLDQVQECVAVQLQAEAEGRERPKLGEVLVARGYLTREQVTAILQQQQQPEPEAGQPVEVVLSAGERIFSEGDSDDCDLYILLRGTVELYRNGILIAEFDKSGIFLGESSALLKKPRATTAQAKTDCRLYRIPQARVELFFRSKPAMALRLAELMAERLHGILHTHVGTDSGLMKAIPAQSTTSLALTEDLKTLSLNGVLDPQLTYLNGFPIEGEPVLQDGDTLQFGPHTFAVKLNDPEALPIEQTQAPEEAEDSEEREEGNEALLPSGPAPEAASPAPSALIGGEASSLEIIDNILEQITEKPFLASVVKVVALTAQLYDQLDQLEERRKALEAPWTQAEEEEELPEALKAELDRQRRERNRFPQASSLANGAEKVTALLKAQAELAENPPNEEELEEGEEAPRLLPSEQLQALELGLEQQQVLLQRARHVAEALSTCAEQTVDEPLYRILSSLGIESHRLFGWATYAQALQELMGKQRRKMDQIRKQRKSQTTERKGLLSKLRKGEDESESALLAQLDADEEKGKALQRNITQELTTIERDMVNEFWAVYKEAALLLVADRVETGDQPFLRAFLRWGLLGCSPRFLDRERASYILKQCTEWVEHPQLGLDDTPILYSDEIIELAAHGKIPASPNEDLELNHRNSPEWKADRSLRKLINCRARRNLLQEVLEQLLVKISQLRQEQAVSEKRENLIKPNTKANKLKLREQKQETQLIKVKAGRIERLAEKVKTDMLTKLNEEGEMAQTSLEQAGATLSPAELAAHEVDCTRRFSRLVAKLKEPFLPFLLQDQFKLDNGSINDRNTLAGVLVDLEKRDPLLFQEALVPVNKRTNRVLVRYAPIVVITPCSGIMGFMLSPRGGLENGRFILPGYLQRSNHREPLLWDVLSDLRFDTSKASAGVDVMNSETLVAAYAQVRWDLRKKDREARQKAGIYTEENERTNWRRHYALYMKSAFDNGKLLYYKCPELYDLIINKYIDLPEGGEKMRR
jgi:hypothetical protein